MKKNKSLEMGGVSDTAITMVQSIKLGLDVHADSISVARIIDGLAPQPAQRFSPDGFLVWAQKQLAQAQRVYACYEAGPLGYCLQRRLMALGVVCYVVPPRDWDQYGKKVKTDRRDAQELALALDRYVSGNTKALCVVRVPTAEEEQRRSLSRHRESLGRHLHRLAAQGRGDALYYGYRLGATHWWKGSHWKSLEKTLPEHLLQRLRSLRTLIEGAEGQLAQFTQQIEQAVRGPLPKGLGKMTSEILEREVADWKRFENRRQVGSYTGLCPREDSSGPRRFQGHVNKHGNRRLRPALVECAWRLHRYQPNYRAVKKWRAAMLLAGPSRRKQIIVATARQFAVDWWRIRTGRVDAQSLGLI